MAVSTLTTPEVTSLADDDLGHYFCECNPDLALCGSDISGAELLPTGEELPDPCVVCQELADLECPRCGE